MARCTINYISCLWVACCLLLATSCSTLEQQAEAEPLKVSVTSQSEVEKADHVVAPTASAQQPDIRFSETPTVPYTSKFRLAIDEDPMKAQLSGEQVAVNFYDMPIGRFINEVFGNILGLSFEIDDRLRTREDLVTVRSAERQSHYDLYRLARQVLLNYGVGIQSQASHVRFVPAQDPDSKDPPLFITGAALPDTPPSHRPVFRFVQLKAVRENTIRLWIDSAFKELGLIVQTDPMSNSIVLQGPADVVNQAAETIALLDRPNMRGSHSVRISPSFVDATSLAKMLTDVLESEGIGAVQKPPFGSVIVLPMVPNNSVIVFAADLKILDHVKEWAVELDQPVSQSAGNDFFYYQVKNTSASDLAEALGGMQEVVEGEEGIAKGPTGIYVDKNRNGLIFTGGADGWKGFLPIIKAMDRPARLVNIEVTVASVTLTDDSELGVEWLFNDTHGDFTGVGRTDFGIGASGFSYTMNNSGQVRFALNALSQDSRVSILSKPSILVKSGDTASIDVGQEIPIATGTSQSTTGEDTPIITTITYRKTGVLLEVEPTVHSGNRVDLNIKQEVSEVLDSVGSAGDSPSIFNRTVQTSLTLSDGGAVILGGLISSSSNEGSSRVPFLGSIPGFGALFRSSGNQEIRSELILVIQAYILDIEEKDWNFNEQLRRKLNLLEVENLELN